MTEPDESPAPAADRAARPWPIATLTLLAGLGALGSAMMTLAHLGIDLRVLTLFGPARLILPAAIGFATGTLLYVVVAVMVWHRRRSAWWFALVVNVLAMTITAVPFRNWVSGAAIVVSLAALVVLVSPAGRGALR